MSDRTWGRFGRRRPYFAIGAVLASLALFVMPNSPALWVAAGMLWVMDASINVAMEPFRAFVGDMLPERQRTAGFAMQSFFIGIGAVVASALPWIMANWFDVSNTAPAGQIPDSVKLAFYLGGAVFFLAVTWTVLRTREYSPEELARFEQAESPENAELPAEPPVPVNYRIGGIVALAAGGIGWLLIQRFGLDKELYILAGGIAVFGALQLVAATLQARGHTGNGLYEIMDDLFRMPRVMRQLAVVQFFSWFALFAMWIYGTAAVTSHHYGALDSTSAAFNDGADWVGVLFACYNGFAALAAIAIPKVANNLGCRWCHLLNLSLGGFGLMSFFYVSDPRLLLVSMIGVGIAWASILSLPYALLSNNLPANKMGVYMGIFNFFIVIPQLVAASILGLIVNWLFDGQSIYALVVGGASMILAGLSTLLVDKDAEPKLA
jgi:maltose/moltooligosaccharide transporter